MILTGDIGLDPKTIADVTINLFGAVGVMVVAGILATNSQSPVVLRIRWTLRAIAILFIARSVAWILNSDVLGALTMMIGAIVPLMALLVAEGLLRRHAPRVVKLGVTACVSVAMLAAVVPGLPASWSSAASLIMISGGFALVGALLLLRHRDTLSPGENAGIKRALAALVILLPAIATDFPVVVPAAPVRLGALGTLVLLFFAFAPSGNQMRLSERCIALVVFLGIGVILGTGYWLSLDAPSVGELVRAAAVGLSGLLVAALVFETMGARAERRQSAPRMLRAETPAAFIEGLGDHPAIGAVHHLGQDRLRPLAHPAFTSLIAASPVLRAADAPWGRSVEDPGVERAMSLLKTYEATHALVLSTDPIEVAVFQVPLHATDARLESEITVAQRVGRLLFADPAAAGGHQRDGCLAAGDNP